MNTHSENQFPYKPPIILIHHIKLLWILRGNTLWDLVVRENKLQNKPNWISIFDSTGMSYWLSKLIGHLVINSITRLSQKVVKTNTFHGLVSYSNLENNCFVMMAVGRNNSFVHHPVSLPVLIVHFCTKDLINISKYWWQYIHLPQ